MLRLLRGVSDLFDLSYWKVIWIGRDRVTKSVVFPFKHEARAFYEELNVYHKRMEKLK